VRGEVFTVALVAAFITSACGEAGPDAGPVAPTTTRAVWVLEPSRIAVGDVAVIELAAVTPPGHTVKPLEPPNELPGFWVLDSEAMPVLKEPSRWVHRTRLRVRARAVGRFVWPGDILQVEAPDGTLDPLVVKSLPLEVVSELAEHPERLAPYDLRDVREPAVGARTLWLATAGGAAGALACVFVAARVRRRLRTGEAPGHGVASAPREPPWIYARAALDRADAVSSEDPLAAAHAVAGALRRYAAARFGADAPARTTEELENAAPPFAAASRWPAFLAILRGLDEFRFRPPVDRSAVTERLRTLAAQARAFVEETVPPESMR
jgi:hypothetical protein